jgi:hypothetical protein
VGGGRVDAAPVHPFSASPFDFPGPPGSVTGTQPMRDAQWYDSPLDGLHLAPLPTGCVRHAGGMVVRPRARGVSRTAGRRNPGGASGCGGGEIRDSLRKCVERSFARRRLDAHPTWIRHREPPAAARARGGARRGHPLTRVPSRALLRHRPRSVRRPRCRPSAQGRVTGPGVASLPGLGLPGAGRPRRGRRRVVGASARPSVRPPGEEMLQVRLDEDVDVERPAASAAERLLMQQRDEHGRHECQRRVPRVTGVEVRVGQP